VIHLDAGGVALLAAATVLAAAVNAVAGGGSLVSFPALLALGYPALTANVTNTVGLLGGYAGTSAGYRVELGEQRERLAVLGVAGGAGALVGALLLTRSSPTLFRSIIPWLVLASCALLAIQPLVTSHLDRVRSSADHQTAPLVSGVFVGGVYGAFFGAGLGVMLLALLGITMRDGLQRLNALKGLLSLQINVVAAIYFVFLGHVAWSAALTMLPAGLAGGLLGTALARRLNVTLLRAAAVALGVAVAVRLLV